MDIMQNEIKPPPEFYELAHSLRVAEIGTAKSDNDFMNLLLSRVDISGKRALQKFLAELLAKNPDEVDWNKLWKSVGSNYYFVGRNGEDGVRRFFTMVKDQIDKELPAKS